MKDLNFFVRLVLEETYIWITCLGLLNFWGFEPGEQTCLHHMVVLLGRAWLCGPMLMMGKEVAPEGMLYLNFYPLLLVIDDAFQLMKFIMFDNNKIKLLTK